MRLALEIPNSLLLAKQSGQTPADQDLLEDQSLLTDFQNGDHDAFATLYRRHARAVFHFAFYMAANADTADELTQDVFVWLIHHPEAFDPARGTLPAFLGGVARKFFRRRQRAQSKWAPLEDALHLLHSISLSRRSPLHPESALAAVRLREAIARLPNPLS